jgi:hypothetical protein
VYFVPIVIFFIGSSVAIGGLAVVCWSGGHDQAVGCGPICGDRIEIARLCKNAATVTPTSQKDAK